MTKSEEKALAIRAIITDVDGVLTDGGIIYDNEGNEFKRFHARDGMLVRPLQKMGFIVGAITGRKSAVVARRLNELKLDFHFHGIAKKIEQYEAVKEAHQLEDREIAYIGDDGNDLPVLLRCGLSACPSDAATQVRERVDLVLEVPGGFGAFRAFGEYIIRQQDKQAALLDHWGVS